MHSPTCVWVVVRVVRKLHPCLSYSGRRDRINLVLLRSYYKGGGGVVGCYLWHPFRCWREGGTVCRPTIEKIVYYCGTEGNFRVFSMFSVFLFCTHTHYVELAGFKGPCFHIFLFKKDFQISWTSLDRQTIS